MDFIFRIYTVLYILFYLHVTFNPETMVHYGFWEMIDIIVSFVSLAGMAAYTFRFRLLSRLFWEYFFYVFIIFEMVYMTWLQLPLLEELQLSEYAAAGNLFNAFMLVPVVYALFMLQQRWDLLFEAPQTPSSL
jgi:hypothetical protein